MSTTTRVNYVEVIKDIEEFYSDNAVSTYCPVAGVDIKFKPISVAQFRTFIELQVAAEKDEFGVIPGLKVVSELNKVIVGNSLEHGEKLMDSLTTVDRDAIVLQLRAYTKNEAEVVAGEDDETQMINLDEIIKKMKANKFPSELKKRATKLKFGKGVIEINLRLPSLRVDNDINDKFRAKVLPKLNKGRKNVQKEAETILSQVYFLEICKYIDNLVIGKGSNKNVIDFSDLDSFDQNFLLLEKLPTKVVSEVSTYMTDVRKYRDSIFSYVNLDNKEVPLDIDIALFAGI